MLTAGRTRHRLHWAFAVAALVIFVLWVAVAPKVWAQRGEMNAAAGTEVDAYSTANAAAFALFDLRTDEMDAVASGSLDEEFYAAFRDEARDLVDRLGDGGIDEEDDGTGAPRTLPSTVRAYVQAVVDRQDAGDRNDDQDAADATLSGDSMASYRAAREAAIGTVNRSRDELVERLEAAAAADVTPLVPVDLRIAVLVLGLAAAGLASAGVVLRGWEHLTVKEAR